MKHEVVTNEDRQARLKSATMSVLEASKMLGMSKDAVYRAARQGTLPAITWDNRVVLVRADIERIAHEGLMNAPGVSREDIRRMTLESRISDQRAQLAQIEAQADALRTYIHELERDAEMLERSGEERQSMR
ncbi:MAG: helix-turn-helix domain-containing protein [Armatimonadota bacterium]